MIEDLPILEKTVKFQTGEPQQLAGLEVRKRACTIAFHGKRFQCVSPWVLA